jgi:hypothetical protein
MVVDRLAVTNGTADPGDPAVVALVDKDGATRCTGALIAEHVVLTAAHCQIRPDNHADFRVVFGAAVDGGTVVDISDATTHPRFEPATWRSDLALLVIRQAAPAAPLPLDPRDLDGALVGEAFAAVGFGRSGIAAADEGVKRSGTARVTALGDVDLTTAPAPSQPCAGDSGGPALFTVEDASVITGVVSHGDDACQDHATYARVDVARQTFIAPYLAAMAPGARATGEPCRHDDHCAEGPCLQAADEPSLWFCGRVCADRTDCPDGMTCAADGCRYPVPSPGALGSPCTSWRDCVDQECFEEEGVCTRRCVAFGENACPAGHVCTYTSGVDFFCLAEPAPRGDGCATAPVGDLGSGLLVGLALLWIRRCRRRPVPA